MLAITKDEIRKLLTAAAMKEQNTLRGASDKLVKMYRPDWKMKNGKSIADPSVIECVIEETYANIYTDPYASK